MQKIRLKSLFGNRKARIVVLVVVAFLAGYFLKSFSQQPPADAERKHSSQEAVAQIWTCSMHPQIRQPKPGKCPICFMDLVPVSFAGTDIGERQITFSEAAVKLMEIETSVVERRLVTTEIRMVGKIDYDETRVKNITAWVPGRIDRLYVDFTGITVNKGDHMVYLYSPHIISAQAELLQASKAAGNIKSGTSELVKRSTMATLEAAREKLRLLGLTAEQIDKIETSGKPVTHITIYSPVGGIVIHKNATEGMYVDTGTPIYTVTDLFTFVGQIGRLRI